MSNILEMDNRREKRIEIWDSWVVVKNKRGIGLT